MQPTKQTHHTRICKWRISFLTVTAVKHRKSPGAKRHLAENAIKTEKNCVKNRNKLKQNE